MSKRKKPPAKITVDLDPMKKRNYHANATSFKKGGPNPGFKPGQSGSPGSKPKSPEKRILSRAINVFLSDRAGEEVAKSVGLPENPPGSKRYIYSLGQVLGRSLILRALKGESWAASLVVQLTEPQHSRLTIGGFDDEDGEARGKILELVMVSSDGNGNISEESLRAFPELSAKTIEGQRPNLPAPED